MWLKLVLILHVIAISCSFSFKNDRYIFGCKHRTRVTRHVVDFSHFSDELISVPSQKLQLPEIQFQLSSLLNKFNDYFTDWGLFSKGDISNFHGPSWLTFFDIYKLPFINSINPNLDSFILNLPIYQRLLLGVTLSEIIPLLIDFAIIATSVQKLKALSVSSICEGKSIEADSTIKDIAVKLNRECKLYSMTEISMFYSQYPLLVFKRLYDIIYIAQPILYAYFMESFGSNQKNKSIAGPNTKLFVNIVTQLGPTFVLITQSLVSLRPHFLSEDFLAEMITLKEHTQLFDSVIAVKLIEESLSIKVDDVFCKAEESFREPVTFTSLCQVYRSQLKVNNEEVTVKVQRPYIKLIVTLDLHILRLLLNFVLQNRPEFREECKAIETVLESLLLLDELPYAQMGAVEGHVPNNKHDVYKQYSNDMVLVSPWVQPLSDKNR